jgi:NAD(P)-dependent dehydrogenase (short-subunit alcohol dehydrogenase family)
MELNDKNVVVTGAGSGIGRALAARFAAKGARVVVADLHDGPTVAVAEAIGATAVPTDVGSEAAIVALIERAREANGPIDLFFSNAGIPGPGGGPEAPDDEWQLTWQINVMSHIWAARHLVPAMVERGEGYIASTASAAGLLTQISAAAYSVTKHAAVAFAEWLAIAYGDAGITVSVLCPQGVRTPMLDHALSEDPVGSAPLLAGGLLEPDDVADAVVAGLRDERFLILPHPQVADHLALKATQPDRWIGGMRKLLRNAKGDEDR